uniref:Uncharacterized protein n=1 Tax=Oryza nivara TaxID=4536 RepID=A0A0E0H388_ORYNI
MAEVSGLPAITWRQTVQRWQLLTRILDRRWCLVNESRPQRPVETRTAPCLWLFDFRFRANIDLPKIRGDM